MTGAAPLLAIRDLRIVRGPRTIVDGVSLSLHRGELAVVMGASGTGKTTLLRAIAGLDPFAAGEIDIAGVRLRPNGLPSAAVRRDLHRQVGMVFQFHHLFAHLTAVRNVWLAPVHVQGAARDEAEQRARGLLDTLGVGARADAFPHELSGGEAQRVAIARALAVDPPLLLMDEPTASLDPNRRGELAATLTALVAQGRSLLVATHDSAFARACAQRVIVLEEGRVAKDGTPASVP
jgi:ABC-type polar amino acid transport system ATPase subunit